MGTLSVPLTVPYGIVILIKFTNYSIEEIKLQISNVMENKKRVTEFSANRKISYDGECYLTRVPLEIMKTLQHYNDDTDKAHWEGVWNDGKKRYVILSFEHENTDDNKEEYESIEEDEEKNYVILDKDGYDNVYKKRIKKGSK